MSKDVILSSNWQDSVAFNEQGLVTAIAQDHQTQRVLMVAWMNREALETTVRTGFATYFSRSRGKLWHKGEESGNQQKVLEIRLDCDGDVIVLKVEQQGGIACHTGRQSCFYYALEAKPQATANTAPTAWHWVAKDPVLKDPALLYAQGQGHAGQHHANKPAAPGTDLPSAALSSADLSSTSLSSAAATPTQPGSGTVLEALTTVLHQRQAAAPESSYVASLFAKGQDALLKKIGEEACELVMASKDLAAQLSMQGNAQGSAMPAANKLVGEAADLWFHSLLVLHWHGYSAADVLAELNKRMGLSGLAEKAQRGGA